MVYKLSYIIPLFYDGISFCKNIHIKTMNLTLIQNFYFKNFRTFICTFCFQEVF